MISRRRRKPLGPTLGPTLGSTLGSTLGMILALAWPATARPQPRPAEAFALVVGFNQSRDAEVTPLRYADDDAIQNALLMSDLGAQVVLLTELDPASRRVHGSVPHTAPTRAAVQTAMAHLNGLMSAARERGARPVFYLFYSGHGDVQNNRGYVNLKDARLWREELRALLEGSAADENHVVIDACQSYFLVFERGAKSQRAPVGGELRPLAASLPDDTGFLLSTSAAAESHEWEAFQAGVFSHEVRSALRGGADQDLDGRVTYEEVAAFVWSANREIINPKYRPQVFSRPPGGQQESRAVVVVTDHAVGDRLTIGPALKDHIYIEDHRGVRLADARAAPSQELALLLPQRRPLFVRFADDDREVVLPAGSRLVLADLEVRRATATPRGAGHVAFQALFRRPFGAAAVRAFRERPADGAAPPPLPVNWTPWRIGLGAAGGTTLLAAAAMSALSFGRRDAVTPTTDGAARQEINNQILLLNGLAVTAYTIGGAAALWFAVWTLLPDEEPEIEVLQP